MLKSKMYMIIFSILISFSVTFNVFAAPPPNEVEELKQSASVHLIGVVVDDQLINDLTKEMGTYYQIRKMKLKVKVYLKNNHSLPNVIDVFYSYIPSWKVKDWSGGARVDIALNDEIEIWLEEGEYGLEPVLGGNTIHHLKYEQNRNEPIKEPWTHFIKRNAATIWFAYSTVTVFCVLLLIWIAIIVSSFMKRAKS